jgi:hypothetical protein
LFGEQNNQKKPRCGAALAQKESKMFEYRIDIQWDPEAAVWIATSNDIPGLTLESGSLDALVERVRFAAPELLELNGTRPRVLPLHFHSERHEQITV